MQKKKKICKQTADFKVNKLPEALDWQAQTSPKPPLPKTRYIRKVL